MQHSILSFFKHYGNFWMFPERLVTLKTLKIKKYIFLIYIFGARYELDIESGRHCFRLIDTRQ